MLKFYIIYRKEKFQVVWVPSQLVVVVQELPLIKNINGRVSTNKRTSVNLALAPWIL